MHLVIALIGVLSGLLLLFRLWRKSRAEKLSPPEPKPFHARGNPVDAIAVLILGIAKCDGDMSPQQADTIQNLFENEFNMSTEDAQHLFNSSATLLENETLVAADVEKVLSVSRSMFSRGQAYSLISLMGLVSEIDGTMNDTQEKMILGTQNVLAHV